VQGFRLSRDCIGGLIVAAVGIAFLAGSLRMRIGGAMDMGPGYFPLAASILVVLLGLWIAAAGYRSAEVIDRPEWRPALSILASVAIFALVLDPFGLLPAVAAGSLVASLGDRTSRPLEAVLLAVGTALACWLIFSVGLGLQMPGFKIPAWLG
jgi:hypothetical protein